LLESKADSELPIDWPEDEAGRVVRSLRRPEACVRFGPLAVSTANIAVTGSILLHVLIGVALVTGRINLDPPVMEVAQGEEAADVSVQFLNPQQLQELLNPQPEELTASEPINVPVVKTDPPTPKPDQMPTLSTEPRPVALRPIEVVAALDLPVTRPSSTPLQRPVTTTDREPPPEEPAEAPATKPAAETAQNPAGVDREPREIELPRPKYPTLSRRMGEQGEVILSARIGVDGKARDIRVERSPGHRRLEDAAIAALKAAHFEPAQRAGRPVTQRVSVPFRFRLKN
jgi:protein TonB